jgi:hypothetical protein
VRITRPHPHMLRHIRHNHAWICATCRSPPATRTRVPPCVMTGPARTPAASQLHPGRVHGLQHVMPPAS